MQDVLVKIARNWDTIEGTEFRRAYVRRMIVNELVSWRRKWARLIPTDRLPEPEPERDIADAHGRSGPAAGRAGSSAGAAAGGARPAVLRGVGRQRDRGCAVLRPGDRSEPGQPGSAAPARTGLAPARDATEPRRTRVRTDTDLRDAFADRAALAAAGDRILETLFERPGPGSARRRGGGVPGGECCRAGRCGGGPVVAVAVVPGTEGKGPLQSRGTVSPASTVAPDARVTTADVTPTTPPAPYAVQQVRTTATRDVVVWSDSSTHVADAVEAVVYRRGAFDVRAASAGNARVTIDPRTGIVRTVVLNPVQAEWADVDDRAAVAVRDECLGAASPVPGGRCRPPPRWPSRARCTRAVRRPSACPSRRATCRMGCALSRCGRRRRSVRRGDRLADPAVAHVCTWT